MKHTIVALLFSTAINILGLWGGLAVAATVEEAVSERTQPVGTLCMAGDACAATAQPASPALAGGKRTGKDIYDAKCMACHTTGAAGAPLHASADAWIPRISKGIDTLFANSIAGINSMPAKGLCSDCSDNEIKETVCYMVDAAIPDDQKTDDVKTACASL